MSAINLTERSDSDLRLMRERFVLAGFGYARHIATIDAESQRRAIRGKDEEEWAPHADVRASARGYQVWLINDPTPIYQITRKGAPAPSRDSGYFRLDSMLKLKKII